MAREREVMEVDVLFVGAGPASLSGALHLTNLIRQHNQQIDSGQLQGKKLADLTIAVIEKGKQIGGHSCSGAVLDPRALQELIPDFLERNPPLEAPVHKDELYFLTEKSKYKFPVLPPSLNNHGNYIISLARFTRWLAAQLNEEEAMIIPEYGGYELLYEEDRVVGVRTSDKGVDKDGQPKANYEPGADIRARVTILGEGVRGGLTKQLVRKFNLDRGRNPQAYEAGVKEIWRVPAGRTRPGLVVDTMGWPLKNSDFGGAFVYHMADNLIDVGFVVSLDSPDPALDPHLFLQRFKTHPLMREMLAGGELVEYGAKALPAGGYYAVPLLVADGALIIGDAGGLLNMMRLKGIHLAMKSGMLAAETAFSGLLKDDFSRKTLSQYHALLEESWVEKEMYGARNFHQSFHHGFMFGLVRSGMQMFLGGRDVQDHLTAKEDHLYMQRWDEFYGQSGKPAEFQFDGVLTFDKLSDVYKSGTIHEENQPSHLVIADYDVCNNRCTVEYRNPCEKFCPASVYEIEIDEDTGKRKLKLNPSNCVHCKTCDIRDPYGIITWVTPEGGGGPNWTVC